jgi:hypothetical protein
MNFCRVVLYCIYHIAFAIDFFDSSTLLRACIRSEPGRLRISAYPYGVGYLKQTVTTVHRCFRWPARLGHNAGMALAPNFKVALTRTIEPTAGLGVELAALEDAARFVAMLQPWRQERGHWYFAAKLLLNAAETGKRRDVEAATAQMERALRVEGRL